ncbi:putative neuraminidase [Duganella sp. 3397]|uniref:sialidase family protein n=1 Tax=Duganella sp. 3397 TaxID=2817732 RepID=UPI002862CCBC|nr:sialidase family protein [Duganella sp. 3397]MDR7052330.1 putative neuraminidase [Duganella sp. 3397]
MGALPLPVQRPAGKLLAVLCIAAAVVAVGAETWRWSRAALHHERPATIVHTGAPVTGVTELSHAIIPMPEGVPSAHASSLTSLPGGGLVAFWWAGSRESGPDVKVYASRWANGKWSKNWEVASRESLGRALGFGVRRIGNPVAWTAADGTLHLYVVATGLGGWAAARVVQMTSHDQGATFAVKRVLPMSPLFNTSTLVRAAPVALADGSWWLPAYFEIGYKYPMLLSFNADGEPQRMTRIGTRTQSLQPSLVSISPTEVRAWMRDDGVSRRVQQAVSRDGGQTWSDLDATALFNDSTALSVLRLPNGSLLMLHNREDIDGSARSALTISLSTDARTWRPLIDVVDGEAGDEFSYPAMSLVGDQLHITYTYQRRAIAHHQYRINLQEEPK